ncbi:NEIL3 Endonuclease, partial [Furnarius figulus]|nr:NEIL3 Endonuclease [Furnarius figulus]
MVEGPCCVLCGERLRARVARGQRVRAASGRAVSGHRAGRGGDTAPGGEGTPRREGRGHRTGRGRRAGSGDGAGHGRTAASEERISGHDFLVGHVYRGVETLGKELFMYFDQKALRIHFGMNGSMCINPDGSKDRNGAPPVLEIQFTEDTVCFFGVTVEYRNAAEIEQKVRMMESLDVCSQKFSFIRAESEIKQHKTRMLCDVLLDQAVLPGVGNIIKNEALFDSGLHPGVKVCQLTDEHIHHLVKMTRDFTLLFYKVLARVSEKHPKHDSDTLAICDPSVKTVTRCNRTSVSMNKNVENTNIILLFNSKLPARNSLIGWAYGRGSCSNEHVARKSEEEWTCMRCTLTNKPSAEICDACLTSRPEGVVFEIYFFLNMGLLTSFFQTFKFLAFSLHVFLLFAKLTTVSSEHCGFTATSKDASKAFFIFFSGIRLPIDFLCIKVPWLVIPSTLCRNCFITCHYSTPQANRTDDTDTLSTGRPRCSKHSRLCSLRVVRKDGENKGRQFYSCPLPRETRCDYFQWADLDFPFCNHGKRCVMKTVLKIGPNNGQNFFVCPLGKEKQCGFFQWAKNGPGIQILP